MAGCFQGRVACFATDASNDKEQGIPLAEATQENFRQAAVALPKEETGASTKIPATRGLWKSSGEWCLVCLTHNLRKL